MNRSKLLLAIQMYDFYLYELNLYLDTHPTDQNALALFRKTRDQRNAAYESFIGKYGPITADQTYAGERFTWVEGPWPWERSAN